MTEALNSEKKTLGEELFLVHLSRSSKEELQGPDFDHVKTSSLEEGKEMTVGEELWRVHVKRSQGVLWSGDNDEEPSLLESKDPVKASPDFSGKDEQKIDSHYVIHHLRNRDIVL